MIPKETVHFWLLHPFTALGWWLYWQSIRLRFGREYRERRYRQADLPLPWWHRQLDGLERLCRRFKPSTR